MANKIVVNANDPAVAAWLVKQPAVVQEDILKGTTHGRPLSFDGYKALLREFQKSGVEYSERVKGMPPAVAADFRRHMSDSKEWTDSVGKVLKVGIPLAVGGAGLAATGVFGAGAQSFVTGASAATGGAAAPAAGATIGGFEAAALPAFDTGVGGLFGSQAAIDTALGAAGVAGGSSLSTAPLALGGWAPLAGSTAAGAAGGTLSSVLDTISQGVSGVLSDPLKALGGVGGALDLGLGVAGAITASQAAKDQAAEEQATARYNAREAEAAAQNALLRGEEEARDIRRYGSSIEGSQRATFAARGLVIDEGTPRAVIEQTGLFAAQDQATARANAAREAATYRRQGSRFNAAASNINPSRTATLSLVGDLAQVAAKWYNR